VRAHPSGGESYCGALLGVYGRSRAPGTFYMGSHRPGVCVRGRSIPASVVSTVPTASASTGGVAPS
jgi:hypothetical protein